MPRSWPRPKTKWGLLLDVEDKFGIRLPYKTFLPGVNSTPLDFVFDAVSNPSKDIAAWASRSGGKTLGASILAALEFLYLPEGKMIQARVLSGSEDQAKNLYEYWQQWCMHILADRIDGDVKKHLTRLVGGSRFEILAASQKRVRGPKVQRLYEDELDEIDPDVDAAAVGMIDTRDDIPGRTIYTSTWHKADGPMAKLIESSPGNGVSVHKWSIWESLARCPAERQNKGGGCMNCALYKPCVYKAREFHDDPSLEVGIAAEACGLYSVEDAAKAYSKVGKATWESEFLCLRPSVEGLVFPAFDPRVHGVAEAPSGLTVYRAIDWGMLVFVCLWIGETKEGVSYLLDTYRAEEGTIPQHARFIKQHRIQNVTKTYCDPAGRSRNDQTGRSNVDTFKSEGIPCTYTTAARWTDIHNGVTEVRTLLQPAKGEPRLYYVQSDNNQAFVKAMQSYRNRKVNSVWVDDPQDPQEFEHIPDAFRYYAVNRRRPDGITVRRLATG